MAEAKNTCLLKQTIEELPKTRKWWLKTTVPIYYIGFIVMFALIYYCTNRRLST